ncbi:hypothetical protein FDP41_001512 [Naegleria fowleri]|uniref:G-protein coupled receptors family 1 profile domain-containing protein n=1 Tax=Naegleria fowleri TaxID=5763 RepID=A0A6A5C1R5_NAEFO|nr:uncharacterized protein FDP41_001512 [Naegleria fowleri]KAF0979169.1 hypothetical protein FDP41_001512 [Naegleria fowleri]
MTSLHLIPLQHKSEELFEIALEQNNSSSPYSNITQLVNSTNLMASYQYTVFAINGPFLVVFSLTSVVIFSIMIKLRNQTSSSHRSEAKKNQRILFSLLLSLSLCSLLNMFTRIGSELTYIGTQLKTVLIVFSILKGIDRSVLCLTTLFEFLLITFVSHVFLGTTRKVGAISEKKYRILRILVLHVFTTVLTIVIITVAIFCLVVGGVSAAELGTMIANYLVLSSLIVAALAFALITSLQLSFMHYVGFLLLQSIQQGEQKILQSPSLSTFPKTQVEENPKSQSFKTLPPLSVLESVNMKRVALKKAISILIGVTFSLLFQFFGFFCIPLAVVNSTFMLIFYGLHDITLAFILILFVIIYRPLHDIQETYNESFLKQQQQHRSTTTTLEPHSKKVVASTSV